MSKSLRKVVRYAQRARSILLNQGSLPLIRAIERRLKRASYLVKRTPCLLEFSEPFEYLHFPKCPMPTASVIVPMQGDPGLTHRCLAALLIHQGDHSYEVIIVDNRPHADRCTQEALWVNARIIAVPDAVEFGAACNRGAAVAQGEYLVFLNPHTQVQAGWLDAIIDTFAFRSDAGIVGGRLLQPDGRQREAGGIVFNDGGLCRFGFHDDPYRPEYSYLRAVDYCSHTCLATRRASFIEEEGFNTDFAASVYMEIDFAFRLRQAGLSTYYQPLSEVVTFEEESSYGAECGCSLGSSEESVREIFMRRWEIALQRHGSRMDPLESEIERSISKRAFVADFTIPTPDRDSGSFRMANLLAVLQDAGFKITFASMGLEAHEPYMSNLQKRGVECLYRPYEESIVDHLRGRGRKYDLVILSRFDTAAELMQSARLGCPNARILFDTVDLHFLRASREATIRRDRRLGRIARRIKRQELDLIARADATLVVSEAEREILATEAPGAHVRVVSNIHPIHGRAGAFADRAGILFIGGFAHPPNTDAVLFFCQDIFPLVLAVLPEVQFYVIGSDPPPEVARLASDNLRILGYVPDVRPYLNRVRLSVAPLRFGAGVKGKVNQSLAYGLPVVASQIAVEGMFLEDGKSVLIAEGAHDFAAAVVSLYEDEPLWNKLSGGGLAVMEEHFSFAAARKAVSALLAS